MSNVERYDITGRYYPERTRLETDLHEIEDRLSEAESMLSRSSLVESIDASLGIPVAAHSDEQLRALIERLKVQRANIKNELFRLNPSEPK